MCSVLLDVETNQRDLLFDIHPAVNLVTHSCYTTGSSVTDSTHAPAGAKVPALQDQSTDHATNYAISAHLMAKQHLTHSPQYYRCGRSRDRNSGGNKPQCQLCG